MSEPNYAESLRTEMHSVMTPAQPAESTSPAETSVTTDVATDVATADGSTPEAAPAGSDTEGRTPPAQPNTPADVPTETKDDHAQLVSRYGNDPQRLAQEFHRLETIVSTQAKAEKAAKAEQPVPTETVAAPEPPVAVDPAKVEKAVDEFASRDSECRAYVQDYAQYGKQLEDYVQTNGRNQLVGGKLYEVESQIAEINRVLTPVPEAVRQKLGAVQLPEVDELTRADLKAKLQELRWEREEVREQIKRIEAYRTELSHRFDARRNQYRAYQQEQLQQAQAEAESSAELGRLKTSFGQQWTSLVSAAFKTHNVPQQLQEKLSKKLAVHGLAHQGAIPLEELPTFIEGHLKSELDDAVEYHRYQSAQYAKAKIADATVPAPVGQAAVASTSAQPNPDWRKALKQDMRSWRQQR